MTFPTTTFVSKVTVIARAWLQAANDALAVLETSAGSSTVGFIAGGASAVARTGQDKLRELVSVKDYGAVGDGTADDRAAFALAATAVGAGGTLYVPPGTYKISSAIDLDVVLNMAAKATLKPASAILIRLEHAPVAGLYQIFDRSAGGAVEFYGSRVPEVWVEWWGTSCGTGGRTDNNIPIQYACDAVQSSIAGDFTTPAPNGDNNGGIVNFGYTAEYLLSGRIHTRQGVILRGKGQWTSLKVNTGTWGSDTEIWRSENGTGSQFGCRAENLKFDAVYKAGVRCIYAPAWQQGCGLRDCYVQNFVSRGLVFDNAYGGSVGFEIKNTLFTFTVASASNAAKCIEIDIEGVYTVGWLKVILDNVQFETDKTNLTGVVDQIGISAKGRVKITARALHAEGIAYVIALDTDASLCGDTISPGGNSSVIDVLQVASTWTGHIDVTGTTKAGATNLLRSFITDAGELYRNCDPIFGRIIYPHSPSEILATCRNVADAGTLDSTAYGFSGISRTSAGLYRLSFNTAAFDPVAIGGASYRTLVQVGSITGRTFYIATQTATYIDVQFLNLANAAADCELFDVFVYGLGA